MGEMVAVRGLMKRKFPSPHSGTLGVNIVEMVEQFLKGIEYKAVRDDYQLNYGQIDTTVGTVSLLTEHGSSCGSSIRFLLTRSCIIVARFQFHLTSQTEFSHLPLFSWTWTKNIWKKIWLHC